MPLQKALRLIISLLLSVATLNQAQSADNDSTKAILRELLDRAQTFAERMPREKVSVHLDNTGYFKGDKIWFQCYVVDGINNAPTALSHTLYVELLNPRGKVIDRKILKIDNGRCHGSFSLGHLPFYSGFYEIRAYTKYMLNFGDAALYSRAIPVFEAPKVEGDFSKWKMARNISRYPGTRPNTKSGSGVSMRFFPEGGSLIAGVRARVAFEITGRYGTPVEGQGRIIDESNGETVAEIHTVHEGRGYFEMTPKSLGRYKAVVNSLPDNREYSFTLPAVSDNGVGLSVDNISSPDSILVTIRPRKGAETRGDIAGLAVSSRGALWSYSFVDLVGKRSLRLSSREMPSGVSIITLFGSDGAILAERMIFVNNGGYGNVAAALEKVDEQQPGRVTLDLAATDADGNPAADLPLSVSVTDGDNAVGYHGGMLSDLLLSSELKGYIRNPMQYFGTDSDSTRRNLDLLMMVSGWRCYSWEEMADIKPIKLRYYPEQAIDLDGQVVSFVRRIPKADIDISMIVSQKDMPDSLRQSFTNIVTSDSCGRFNLSYDFTGKWDLVMSVSEKGKKKDHRVILDRLFSPDPRKYEPAEISLDNYASDNSAYDTSVSDIDSLKDNEQTDDSISDGSIKLDELVVKAKHSREADIYRARSKSLVYYDMQEEIGDLADKGETVGRDLIDVLKSINPDFYLQYVNGDEKIFYKNKEPLFVIDYERTLKDDSLNHTYLYPEAIKSIFITEDPSVMVRYADPLLYTMLNIDDTYSCAVLIETFPDRRSPAGKGTRLQTIEGYTIPEEFHNIDNALLLDDPDFRRTLYWNPLLVTDAEGRARAEFFNNSTCRKMRVSIQGIDSDGTVYGN